MEKFFEAPKPKLIYVFRIVDAAHEGCLKVGETTFDVDDDTNPFDIKPNATVLNEAARKRIDQYTQTAGVAYELLYTECTLHMRGMSMVLFNDKDVHEVLLRSGIQRKEFNTGSTKQGREWFVTDLATVKNAIAAVKKGHKALSASQITETQSPITFRPEQREAIDKTKKRYRHGNKMLWNAKMRFGKTLSALQVVKEMGFRRTLLYTHRPDVLAGWYDDFTKIFYDRDDYQFGSKGGVGSDLATLEKRHKKEGLSYVYFASLQDLRGSGIVGGKFEKNDDIFSTPWDLIIVDEAHEGTGTEKGKAVLAELEKKAPKLLQLSGTPFNLLDNFQDEEVYTWDYTMEQRAKEEWERNHCGDPNPYAGLPRMNIYTYDLGRLMSEYADEEMAFNFREFFRTDDAGRFVHHDDVARFLTLLSKDDPESMYPYATPRYRNIFRHTLWVLPGVKAARALSAMLRQHTVFGMFDIVNVAGDGDEEEEREKALKKVREAIEKAHFGTITLTVSSGRLTTGVTVPQWMGVLMLAGSYNTAASAYMQTIFRVQTPYTREGLVKEDCYVFDFAPDRTLQVLATVPRISTKAGKTTEQHKRALGRFLNFCPVIGIEGSQMKPYDANKMMEQLKRAYVERVVQNGFEDSYLYNDELMKLDDLAVREFDGLKQIIGETKASHPTGDIDINSQGLTNEEYEEKEIIEKKPRRKRTPEEEARLEALKEKKKLRDSAVSILRGISIRMPLLIYGADIKAEDEDQQLTIHNFASLVDPQSWDEFMPRGVTKQLFNRFKKYYDEDIFTASAKRIRAMARAADRLTIEERIERITAIFRTFRNPDKETVLTPWEVVNRHMSETLGGYTFFDTDFRRRLTEPRYVERQPTLEVYTPGVHLLEINSKSGLYPLYLAYNLYRRALKEELISPQTLDEHQAIWDRVVADSVFVICKTPMAKAITRRTLMGFRPGRVNTRYFEDLVNQIKNKPENFLAKVPRGKTFWRANNNDNMNFQAIVGNPPYQEVVAINDTTNGQKRSSSIFHYFQNVSDKLGKYTSLIYPGARWIHRSGKGLEQFGLAQMNDPHLQLLLYYPVSTDIFKDVGIADGLSIVMKNMTKTETGFRYVYSKGNEVQAIYASCPGESMFPLNPGDASIVENIDRVCNDYAYLHDSVLSQKLFGIESDFVEKNPTLVREYNEGDRFDPDTEVKLFTNDKAGKAGRARWYVAHREVIQSGEEYIGRWKVIVSSANAGGQKRSNQLAIADNNSAFGRSRVALKAFDTEAEARNFYKYCRAELIRFAFLLTDESLTSLAKKVPDLLDYTDNNGIIDYSGDINAQLYTLFNIDEDSQAHIRHVLAQKAE